jgi:hypothetical protein
VIKVKKEIITCPYRFYENNLMVLREVASRDRLSALSELNQRRRGVVDHSPNLLSQFHDILPGSGIREVYLDAAESHQEAQEMGKYEVTAGNFFARVVADASAGRPVTSEVSRVLRTGFWPESEWDILKQAGSNWLVSITHKKL